MLPRWLVSSGMPLADALEGGGVVVAWLGVILCRTFSSRGVYVDKAEYGQDDPHVVVIGTGAGGGTAGLNFARLGWCAGKRHHLVRVLDMRSVDGRVPLCSRLSRGSPAREGCLVHPRICWPPKHVILLGCDDPSLTQCHSAPFNASEPHRAKPRA